MDVNPYESPGAAERPPATPQQLRPVWLDMLYLVITAVASLLLIPVTIFLLFLLVKYILQRLFF